MGKSSSSHIDSNGQGGANRAPWFKRVRGSYLPISPMGWLTYLPFIGYLVFSFAASTIYTSSAVVAVLFVVPNWTAAGVVMTYIAAQNTD